ncbi:MAG: M23 family metallopeptidase [Oleiphilaceae bacterium]|nr:M23 family metallopeptidase [Oleiphilaceae bacterium]
MQVMLFSDSHCQARQFHLGAGSLLLLLLCLLILAGAGGFVGWSLGHYTGKSSAEDEFRDRVAHWEARVDRETRAVSALREEMNHQVDAMTLRLGRMQARLLRLDALGERLVVAADIGNDEFDFASVPAMGGPEDDGGGESFSLQELESRADSLGRRISSRSKQLELLQELIANETLEDARYVEGRPVTWGWLSSRYGYREDPFHGRRTWHSGVDLAGREGGDVVAVGAGVVTVAERRGGYGYFIEIKHGDSLVTRYGHAKKLLVEPGQVVKKGERIALMGSTGRSTGPHVHFEVLKDGRRQDPEKYMQRASR